MNNFCFVINKSYKILTFFYLSIFTFLIKNEIIKYFFFFHKYFFCFSFHNFFFFFCGGIKMKIKIKITNNMVNSTLFSSRSSLCCFSLFSWLSSCRRLISAFFWFAKVNIFWNFAEVICMLLVLWLGLCKIEA